MMTLGSLFDGIGGFPLAAVHCGGVPVWASEIEPFPMRGNQTSVSRYDPCRGHYKTGWSKIAACGCNLRRQPLSGFVSSWLRKGLAGERSGLFMDQVRIVKEDESRG